MAAVVPARLESIGERVRRLVIACIVPAWLAASVITVLAYQRERDALIASTLAQARSLMHQVERELSLSIGVLQTLATASSIDDRNIPRFHARARDVLRHSGGDNIVWFESPTQAVVSAAHPVDQPPRTIREDRFPGMFETGRPAVSDLFVGQVSKQLQVAAAVPVLRGGKVTGRLDMVFRPDRFGRLLAEHGFDPSWTVAVIDRQGRIVARNRLPERFVGQAATALLTAQVRERSEGHFDGRTAEGTPTISFFSRSDTYGWSTAIGVPTATLHAALAARLGLIAASGVLMLGAGLLLARRMSRQIAEPVQALVAPALAIGRGEPAVLPPPALRETAEVAAALRQAQGLLVQREAALRESQSRLGMALDLGGIGTWELDLDSREVTRSGNHDACFGHAEPLVRWTLDDFFASVHPDDRERVDRDMHGRPAGSQESVHTECRVVWPDGSVHWIASQAATIVEDGRPRRMIGIVSDITAAKQAEERRLEQVRLDAEYRQAQEANRLKSEFLANMSHELRTPLNAVIGFADLLASGAVPAASAKHAEFLGHIATGGRHLLQLINDVLDLAKVESGRFEFFPEAIELPRLSREVTGLLQAEAARKHITLVVDHDPTLEGLWLDAARLKQVLYNYLSNAIKFTPAGGHVTLRSRAEGEHELRIEVEDSGVGISEADQARLFNPFQQADAGLGKAHGGTGLGLALTRQLAELQGGRVGLRSRPGAGSTFHVVLPRRHLGGVATPEPVADAPAAPGAPRVLVIEDDVADQARLVQALSAAGYQVDVSGNAEQALRRSAEHRYDAITLDLLLPDRNGLEVLAALRASAAHAEVPVIVVTMVTETSAITGFQVNDVLSKPIRTEALLASLRRHGLREGDATRIMVVDDETASRDLMTTSLASIGMTPLGQPDGQAALDALDTLRPDAMILDLVMPGLNGFDVLDALRARPDWAHLPVFVWTSMDLGPADLETLSRSARVISGKSHGGVDALVAQIRAWHEARPLAA